jgi:hypothetical protein
MSTPRYFGFLTGMLLALTVQSGIAQTNVRSGSGKVVGADILHPVTQRYYDQILLTGPNVTVAADAGQVARVSFLDPDGDITQVEFSGSGTVTIQLDLSTYVPPAAAAKYNQPEVLYVKGRPTVTVNGAAQDTFISIFTVGRGNAVNQTLFRSDVTYDAMADVQLVQIDGSEIGAVLLGNVRFGGSTGSIGLDAANTAVKYRVIVGDLDARDDATPLLRIGSGSALAWDDGAMLIAGGALHQTNGLAVDVSSSAGSAWPQIHAIDGTKSSGELVPAKTVEGGLLSKQPGSVSVNGASRTTSGYVPISFAAMQQAEGFKTFYFGPNVSLQFSGGNTGTYTLTQADETDAGPVQIQLSGTYSYVISSSNQNLVSFTQTLDAIKVTSNTVSFSGSIYDLANLGATVFPVRISVSAEYLTQSSGTATLTVVLTNGSQQSQTITFGRDHPLDFSLL